MQWKQGINRAKAPKQLRLYVAGLTPTALNELLKRGMPIREPLYPNRMRHIEHDISHLPLDAREGSKESRLLEAAGAMAGVQFGWGGDELTMVWPQWENGFGDVIAHTLLPLAEYAHAGPLASPLAVSGLKYPILAQLLRAIAPRACASERPNPPLLPHCNSSCYAAINLCGLDHTAVKDAWAAAATLDRAVGFRAANESRVSFVLPPPRASAGQGGSAPLSPPPPPLRVLLAARQAHRTQSTLTGDRLVVNQEELVEACGGGRVAVAGHELRLECRLMPAGLAMREQSALMQWADVYVCMWGGDAIHALHLRRRARHRDDQRAVPEAWPVGVDRPAQAVDPQAARSEGRAAAALRHGGPQLLGRRADTLHAPVHGAGHRAVGGQAAGGRPADAQGGRAGPHVGLLLERQHAGRVATAARHNRARRARRSADINSGNLGGTVY